MDLSAYRNQPSEKARIADLLSLLPGDGTAVLDIGARDGFISKLLVDRFQRVCALDLERPDIAHERIQCVKGDITALEFADESFDLVFCAEVLEHIPPPMLGRACSELARVSRTYILVGVPYKQDIRLGRTTCTACGGISPPWGHVNTFDEDRLTRLFPGFFPAKQSFVGQTISKTNFFSCWLMDLAGNPYGTYTQEEPCGHCGAKLTPPPDRTFLQKVFTKVAAVVTKVQQRLLRPKPNWIHILLCKRFD
jgi:protein-L-isoaspartate O-methyltransferase